MDPILLGILALVLMFVLIGLHVPIGAAMGIAGFVGFGLLRNWDAAWTLFGTEPTSVLASFDIAVIPLFLLMGGFAGAAGLSSDIYRVFYAFVGPYRGGLAMATIGGCAGFGAVCGTSIGTVATMARIALPEMIERRYSPKLAAGSIAAGGTLGILIPPSVILVLYGILTEQFVLTLFLAAIIPGIVAVLLHIGAIMIQVRLQPDSGPAGPSMSWRERLAVLRQAWGVLLLAFLVIGGIYGGIFTVSEAAAVGAAGAFIFTVARGKLTLSVLREVLSETAASTAMIYLILIGSSIFTYSITASGLPSAIVDGIQSMNLPPIVVIYLLLIMYLILGSVFDTIAAMVLTLPFVFPLVMSLGYDPIWWGIINVMVIEIGMITPPIGINVFVLHGMAPHLPLKTIFTGIGPFVAADLLRLIILTSLPAITLWLPTVLGAVH